MSLESRMAATVYRSLVLPSDILIQRVTGRDLAGAPTLDAGETVKGVVKHYDGNAYNGQGERIKAKWEVTIAAPTTPLTRDCRFTIPAEFGDSPNSKTPVHFEPLGSLPNPSANFLLVWLP